MILPYLYIYIYRIYHTNYNHPQPRSPTHPSEAVNLAASISGSVTLQLPGVEESQAPMGIPGTSPQGFVPLERDVQKLKNGSKKRNQYRLNCIVL